MSRAPLAALAITAAAIALAAPRLAHADEAADKKAATALVDNGAKLVAQGDLEGALDLFRRAYSIYPSPKIFLDFGTTLKKMGRTAEAANDYQRYLDQADPPAARKAEVVKILGDLDRTLGFVTVAITPADGAELRIANATDWAPAGALAKWRVPPGDVVIDVRRPKSNDGHTTVHVAAGATVPVTFALTPVAAVVAPHPPPPPPPPPPPHSSTAAHAHTLGVTARALVDGKGRGGAGALGGVAALGPVDVEAAAIVGPTFGGYAGASFAFTHGTIRPRLAAGIPFYVSSGARWATRLAAGADWRLGAHLSALLEVGVEYYWNPEPDIDKVQVVPVIGVEGWL